MEGYLLAPRNRQGLRELDLLPYAELQKNGGSGSSYLEYISLTWTTRDNTANFGTATEIMVDVFCISTLNFQVDKYLEQVTEDERVISPESSGFKAVKTVIRDLFQASTGRRASSPGGIPPPPPGPHTHTHTPELEVLLSDVTHTL